MISFDLCSGGSAKVLIFPSFMLNFVRKINSFNEFCSEIAQNVFQKHDNADLMRCIIAAKRLFKICCFTIGAPRAVIVERLRGSLVLSKSDVRAYNFFEIFCELALWLEKPKSGEISDVLVLKVGDRGATTA